MSQLKKDYKKIAKLEFLNSNGSVAFTLDDNYHNSRSAFFIQSGSFSCNLQSGRRRQMDVTFANNSHLFDYIVNNVWFGQQLRYSEGLILPDGTPYYIPQGVFEIEKPSESIKSNLNEITYHLVDKWANLDGGLLGNLDGDYSVEAGTNIFSAISSVLLLDRYTLESPGQHPIDPVSPLITSYYNGKTQTLTDGSVVNLVDAPYDLLVEGGKTLADVVKGLSDVLAAWVGYNNFGRLVVDPSQDDILDTSKPIMWDFSMDEKQLISLDYQTDVPDVYNDVIVVGASNDDYTTARGRAQNRDPSSDTCISRIGLKTKIIEMPNYYSNDICEAYAEWMLKRYATVNKTVTVTCTQMFHIQENKLITIRRTDKPGSPVERHLVQGFTRPISEKGNMTLSCVSVNDFPIATIV